MQDQLLDLVEIAERYQRNLKWLRNRHSQCGQFPKPAGKRSPNKKKSRPVDVFSRSQIEQYFAWWDAAPKDKQNRILGRSGRKPGINKPKQQGNNPDLIGTSAHFNQMALRFITGNMQLTVKPKDNSPRRRTYFDLVNNHAA